MTVAVLHPAERRRMKARMPEPPPHDIVLRPLGSTMMRQHGGAPHADLIASSTERAFFDALLADLVRPDWAARLAAMRGRRRGSDGVLELHLPTHRQTQIVLYEVVCQVPGTPRLDPAKITGAGIVVRRRSVAGWEGWMKQGGRRLGWAVADASLDYDPNPAQRRTTHKANAAIRAAIAARKGLTPDREEEVFPLSVLPPAVCAARGKTILFAVLPVTSMDTQETAPPTLDYATLPAADRQAMIDHLYSFLKPRAPTTLPRGGELLDGSWNVLAISPDDASADGRLKLFGSFLHQLHGELGATGGSPAGERLMALLAQIALQIPIDASGDSVQTMDAATFLRRAIPILITGTAPGNTTLRMPFEWPRIDDTLGNQLSAAALDCLSAQSAALATAPAKYERPGSYAGPEDQYAVRGFVRLRGHNDCADRIHWGAYSEPFRILPWWDGDGPGMKIKLPSMAKLRKAKPDVSFEVPPSIAAILQGDMKALAKGEDGGKGLEIGWICSFSLPIITLCAFICLNIFLSLLDIVFSWMAWVKICIPIPKKASDE